MNAFTTLIRGLIALVAFLNIFGGIVSGVWLAVLGEWGAIGIGIIAMLAAKFLIGVALLPTFVIGLALLPTFALGGAAFLARRTRYRIFVAAFLSQLYIAALMTVWCLTVMRLFLLRMHSPAALTPTLIWSYGVAVGPWAYLASKEPQEESGPSSAIAARFCELAYLVAMVMVRFFEPTVAAVVAVFGGIMLVNTLFQMALGFPSARATARPPL